MPLDASRFYAVPERGRMECPKCGTVLRWGLTTGQKWGDWNPLTSTLRCTRCGMRFVLGIVAWPIHLGYQGRWPTSPSDQLGTVRELIEARQQAGGFWMRERRTRPDQSANWYISEGCTCAPLLWRETCAVHGRLTVSREPEEK